ncbi:hypothetical protein EBU95_02185 [bacterium]|nr:hypothetical protein [bacterium]
MSRSFTVDAIYRSGSKSRISGGRYISSTPSGAARKAFSQAYRRMNNTGGRFSLEIHIRETTRGTSDKIFKYRVSRVHDPVQVERGGVIVEYEYQTKVRAI